MALLSFSPAPAKGQAATVTLDKSYLLSMQAVAISDEYYTDPLNIKTVTVIYESEPGKQRYKLTFDFSSASPTAQLDLPAQARNNIFFKTLVLHDYENDKLKLSREQIVLSDESIVDLDISFGPMEETNEIVVTPSDGGDNLYEDFAELFVAKSGGTMTGALTLSEAPSSDLHAATKAYVDSADQDILGAVQAEMQARNDLAADLAAEQSRAEAAEADLAADLAAEQSRAEAAEGSVIPTGTILPYAGLGSAPTGFLICDGSELSKTSYAKLFFTIGEGYGRSENNKFRLPDLRATFLRGKDAGRGWDSDYSNNQRFELLKRVQPSVSSIFAMPGVTPTPAAYTTACTIAKKVDSLSGANSSNELLIFYTSGHAKIRPQLSLSIDQNYSFSTFNPGMNNFVARKGVWVSELNKYIVVGNKSFSTSCAYWSSDGITWNASNLTDSEHLSSVCWSAELQKLVAVSANNSNKFYTSTDGMAWAEVAVGSNKVLTDIVWAKKLNSFIAVGQNIVLKSSDGLSWETLSTPVTDTWLSIAWSDEFATAIVVGTIKAIKSESLMGTSLDSSGSITWAYGGWTDLSPSAPPALLMGGALKTVIWCEAKSLFIAYNRDAAQYAFSRTGAGNTWTNAGADANGTALAEVPSGGSVPAGKIFVPLNNGAYFTFDFYTYNDYNSATAGLNSGTTQFSNFGSHDHGGGYHNHGGGYHDHGGGYHNHGGGNHRHVVGDSNAQSGDSNNSADSSPTRNETWYTDYSGDIIAAQSVITAQSVISGESVITTQGTYETRPVNVYVNFIIKY